MKTERFIIAVLSILLLCSFMVIYAYEKKLSNAYIALRSSLSFNELLISSIEDFTIKFDKLNKLTISSPSIDDEMRLNLITYSGDVSDLILNMNRKIDLSFPNEIADQ